MRAERQSGICLRRDYSSGGIKSYNTAPKTYTAEELNGMTISEIKSLAGGLGYSIAATKKADIVAEFLKEQGGELV